MTSQKLAPSELRLLRDVITKQDPLVLPLLDQLHTGVLSIDHIEALRDALASELCETGLNESDEPNQTGLLLEALIDKLGHLTNDYL